VNLLGAVADKGAGFKSLRDTWADTTTPHGRLMLTVLGGLAEFERELIRSRTSEGRERAKAKGVVGWAALIDARICSGAARRTHMRLAARLVSSARKPLRDGKPGVLGGHRPQLQRRPFHHQPPLAAPVSECGELRAVRLSCRRQNRHPDHRSHQDG
jgi:hypothetical protein